jgi:hypothetical protein
MKIMPFVFLSEMDFDPYQGTALRSAETSEKVIHLAKEQWKSGFSGPRSYLN